jgi:quinol monooxygenase YgiN
MAGTTRRSFIGGAATGGAILLAPTLAAASQQATPIADAAASPGYAAARVRTQPSAALNQAIFPDVMARLLPQTTELPGFHGYTFVFDDDDPATAIIFSTMADAGVAKQSQQLAQDYVAQLDPRFVTQTPLSAENRIRIWATTDTPASELPPFLHGTVFTMRDQTTAPDYATDDLVAIAQETLIPIFLAQPGFVLYCWFERPEGRIAVNIWDTPEDMAAGEEALVSWRDEHFSVPTSSESVTWRGTVGYSTLTGLT